MNKMFFFIKSHRLLIIMSLGILCCVIFLYKECGDGVIRTTAKTYVYSEDNKNCITIIQYMNFSLEFMNEFTKKKENAHRGYNLYRGIYLVPGKFKGRLPDKNYLFIEDSSINYYVKWSNDTTYLILPFSRVKENKLDATKVIFSTDFPLEEKKRYGYYKLKFEEFQKAISKEYVIIRKSDLDKD